MKKFLVFASCALLLVSAGCKKKTDEPTPTPAPTPQVTTTLSGSVDRPSWADPAKYDFTTSQTVLVKVDLTVNYPELVVGWELKEKDALGAFVGNECLGVGEIVDGLFFLYITPPANGNQEQTTYITLRYWSEYFTNLFEAVDAFEYKNDDTEMVKPSAPFVPTLVVAQ